MQKPTAMLAVIINCLCNDFPLMRRQHDGIITHSFGRKILGGRTKRLNSRCAALNPPALVTW